MIEDSIIKQLPIPFQLKQLVNFFNSLTVP